MKEKIIRRAFNAGEVSKEFNYRNDTDKYTFASQTLENFYVNVLGSISRREGTRYLANLGQLDNIIGEVDEDGLYCSNDLENVRLIPFEYNRALSYILAFIPDVDYYKVNVYSIEGELIEQLSSPILSTSTDFQYRQVGGWIYFSHSDLIPQKMYIDDEDGLWKWEDAVELYPSLDVAEDVVISLEDVENASAYNDELEYTQGDIVLGTTQTDNVDTSSITELTSVSIATISSNSCYTVDIVVEKSDNFENFTVGDFVYLSGISGSVTLKISYQSGHSYPVVYKSILFSETSMLSVVSVDGSSITLRNLSYVYTDEYTYFKGIAVYSTTTVLSSSAYLKNVSSDSSSDTSNSFNYYIAINDVPIGTSLLDTDYWEVYTYDSSSSDILYSQSLVNVISDSDFFDTSMIGEQMMIEYTENVESSYTWNYVEGTEYISDIFPASGTVTVTPQGGIWDGTLILESSTDNGLTWEELGRTTSVQGSDNESFARDIYDTQAVVRCRLSDQAEVEDTSSTYVDGSVEGCIFSVYSEGDSTVWTKIISVTNTKQATLMLLTPCRKGVVSSKVYKSCWSSKYGYPRTVDIHEERLTLAGNSKNPATIWLSQTNNWDNFRSVSELDTDPLSYTLASNSGEPIAWLVSKEDMMIGLGNAEWSLGSRDSGQALTSSIVCASNQSEGGSEYIMPTKSSGMVIYVRRGGNHISSLTYDFATDAYSAIMLTTLHPDVMGTGGAKELFNQLSPEDRIWVVRNDGEVALFTYDKANNISAWSRMTFGDGVVSACSVSTGLFKSIFLAVKRNGYLCLERLDPNENGTDNWLDCVPFSDDIEIPDDVQTSIEYTSTLKTCPLFLDNCAKIFSLRFYLLNSAGGQYRIVGFNQNGEEQIDKWQDIKQLASELFKPLKGRDYRFSGSCGLGFLEEASIELQTNAQAPFTLCAIGANIQSSS